MEMLGKGMDARIQHAGRSKDGSVEVDGKGVDHGGSAHVGGSADEEASTEVGVRLEEDASDKSQEGEGADADAPLHREEGDSGEEQEGEEVEEEEERNGNVKADAGASGSGGDVRDEEGIIDFNREGDGGGGEGETQREADESGDHPHVGISNFGDNRNNSSTSQMERQGSNMSQTPRSPKQQQQPRSYSSNRPAPVVTSDPGLEWNSPPATATSAATVAGNDANDAMAAHNMPIMLPPRKAKLCIDEAATRRHMVMSLAERGERECVDLRRKKQEASVPETMIMMTPKTPQSGGERGGLRDMVKHHADSIRKMGGMRGDGNCGSKSEGTTPLAGVADADLSWLAGDDDLNNGGDQARRGGKSLGVGAPVRWLDRVASGSVSEYAIEKRRRDLYEMRVRAGKELYLSILALSDRLGHGDVRGVSSKAGASYKLWRRCLQGLLDVEVAGIDAEAEGEEKLGGAGEAKEGVRKEGGEGGEVEGEGGAGKEGRADGQEGEGEGKEGEIGMGAVRGGEGEEGIVGMMPHDDYVVKNGDEAVLSLSSLDGKVQQMLTRQTVREISGFLGRDREGSDVPVGYTVETRDGSVLDEQAMLSILGSAQEEVMDWMSLVIKREQECLWIIGPPPGSVSSYMTRLERASKPPPPPPPPPPPRGVASDQVKEQGDSLVDLPSSSPPHSSPLPLNDQVQEGGGGPGYGDGDVGGGGEGKGSGAWKSGRFFASLDSMDEELYERWEEMRAVEAMIERSRNCDDEEEAVRSTLPAGYLFFSLCILLLDPLFHPRS